MLVNCPECGHEVSVNAVACPNCGRPTGSETVVERRIVAESSRDEGFPAWGIALIVLSAVTLLVLGFFMLRGTDDQANVNVNVNGRRTTSTEPPRDTRTTNLPSSETQTVTVPPGQSTSTSTTTVPGSSVAVQPPPADKGTVVINASVAPPRGGSPQTVRNARFYLLDEDIESILSKADLEPIEGNSLTASLGLSVVFPDRYGDFNRAAMRAIAKHSKYSGTTDPSGKADLAGIAPDSYYLFGITRVGRGFALWNAPVSVVAGQNVMNLSPQSVTEVADADGGA